MNIRTHFRQIRALLYPLLMAVLILSACQANPELPGPTAVPTGSAQTPTPSTVVTVTPSPTVTRTATLTPAPLALRGVEVIFWHPWQGELAQQVEALLDEFNRSNEWGIHASARAFYTTGALEEHLTTGWTQAAGGPTPTITNTPFVITPMYGETPNSNQTTTPAPTLSPADLALLPGLVAAPSDVLAEWSAAGRTVDLAPYLAHATDGLSTAEVEAFQPIFLKQDQTDLRQGKPHQNGLPALRSARVIFYNQSWAKALGFAHAPTTPAELYAQACAAAIENNRSIYLEMKGTGGYLIDTDALTTLSWMAAFGAQVAPADETLPYTFQTREARAALDFLRKLQDNGCAWVARVPAPQEFLTQHKALFYSGSLSDLYLQQRVMAQAGTGDEWTILPFPGVDGKPVVYASGYSYALLSGTPETQMAAWLLARWLARPQSAAKLAEVLPSLPVSRAVTGQLAGAPGQFPWTMILPLERAVRPAPALRTWPAVRRLMEDAARQAYYQPTDQLGMVLPMLEAMTGELLKRTPGAP